MNAMKARESQVVEVITATPNLDASQIRRRVVAAGHRSLTCHEVNQYLYGSRSLFVPLRGPTARPVWARCQQQQLSVIVPAAVSSKSVLQPLGLYKWQERALAAWIAAGQRGVVEAVTASGKSRLGVAAAAMELDSGGRVVVLVHTAELLRQWRRLLKLGLLQCGIDAAIGILGGGSTDSLASHRILVATVQSAADKRLLACSANCLLIADEVHHHSAETWRHALQDGFVHRLGLTATYERDDDGVERILDPFFGGKCYQLTHKEALADDIIARFTVAFVGVDLTAAEASDYRAASRKMRRHRKKLICGHGVPAEPHGAFIQHVTRLAKSTAAGARLAGFYLSAMTERRGLLAVATGKLAKLRDLAPAIRCADRTILFTQTRPAAMNAVDMLAACGVRGAVLDGKMDGAERDQVFTAFEHGEHELVAAPQLLDEGVDCPAADLALVLAASRSRRQMIQRLGRILRKKVDGRLARLVIFYARDTFEDPGKGGHEAFIDVVSGVADEVRHFSGGAASADIIAYLNDWAR